MSNEVIVAATGASGMPYLLRLLEDLKAAGVKVHFVASGNGEKILLHETGKNMEDIASLVQETYDNGDLSPPIASGSIGFEAMVLVPCSMNTLAKISVGVEDSLITRLAVVALKERRKLILVPRETPLSDIHLDAMAKLSRSGAVIMPAMPGFYNKPTRVEELVEFMVGRMLDHIGVEHGYARWEGE
ncbi:MAG: UbiX family flavin prenyltransferase [Thermoplasmata archaeon]|nr:UbiX family flavin prenyltransferase [Thermoplasmata archaeon]